MSSQRIISLLPAATEIVCALGLEENLVGRSHECDFPSSVKQLPICSEANFPDGLSSATIDKKVKELLNDALSVYTVKREVIKELNPDVVITQAQCEVCAVSLQEVEEALENYLDKEAHIVSLQPNSLEDIFNNIRGVAAALDVIAQGDRLIEDLQERVDIVRHKLKFNENKPMVACIEWLEPLMVSGNWVPESGEYCRWRIRAGRGWKTFAICTMGGYTVTRSGSNYSNALWFFDRAYHEGNGYSITTTRLC